MANPSFVEGGRGKKANAALGVLFLTIFAMTVSWVWSNFSFAEIPSSSRSNLVAESDDPFESDLTIYDINIQFQLSPSDFNLLASRRFALLLGNAVNKFVKSPRPPAEMCDEKQLDVMVVVSGSNYDRSQNEDLVLGVIKPYERDSWGKQNDPDFAIVENRYLQQTFQGNGVEAVMVRYIENNPDVLPHHVPYPKDFTPDRPAIVCYHGHTAHFAWATQMAEALVRASSQVPLVVRVVISQTMHTEIQAILDQHHLKGELVDYKFDTLPQVLSGCDIGLAPQWHTFTETATWGRESSFVSWEVKPQCHITRAIHFSQVGVPVIGEACPDMSEVIGASGIGIIIENPSVWYHRLMSLLTSPTERESYSRKALAYCRTHFSIDNEARKLLKFLDETYKERFRKRRERDSMQKPKRP